MADFCKQCSLRIFGEDYRELADLITAEDTAKGFVSSVVICEGCGPIQVDHNGVCVSSDCMENGHVKHVDPKQKDLLNPCKCVDCGGTELSHSSDCTYMKELHG